VTTLDAQYDELDGLGLAALVRAGAASPLELADEAIRRIERLNPQVNAVVRTMFDEARGAARGPLPEGPFTGVPMLLKDLIATVAGVPTSNGTRWLRELPAAADSELVKRLKRAGVLIVGKTNTPEFGLLPTTEPEAFGPTRNPWDLSRTPGGSSGGSAAAVATRMVPIASGGDGGGSIRVPAACCGLFGMKVTRGRTPVDAGELWRGFANEGFLTRSVRDSAALLDATDGAAPGAVYGAPPKARPFLDEVGTPPGRLRIAFSAEPLFGRVVDAAARAALADTVALLEGLGHELLEATPTIEREACAMAFVTVLSGEIRADIEATARQAGRQVHPSGFETTAYGMGLLGRALSASDYAIAAQTLHRAAREVARFFEGVDLLLTPTIARPPVPLGSLPPHAKDRALLALVARLNAGWLLKLGGSVKQMANESFDFIPYTPLFNVTGQPAMSVPLHWTPEGLPLGLQFVGRFGDEATLFRLAGQLEQARPWAHRRPPLRRG
jgi:amidase